MPQQIAHAKSPGSIVYFDMSHSLPPMACDEHWQTHSINVHLYMVRCCIINILQGGGEEQIVIKDKFALTYEIAYEYIDETRYLYAYQIKKLSFIA